MQERRGRRSVPAPEPLAKVGCCLPVARELELKLEVEADCTAQLEQLLGPPSAQRRQRATYYELNGGDLAAAGYTLRVRDQDGRFVQTVKQGKAAAGLFSRGEWEAEVPGPELDAAALAQTPLAALLAGAEPDPAAVVEVERSIWNSEAEAAAIEASLDVGTVEAGERRQPLHEIELELEEGNPRGLFDLADRISAHLPTRIGVMTKAERALRLAADQIGAPAKAEAITLTPDMTVADAFAATAHSCLRHYRLNEPLLATEDPTALHQARVAMCRLRSPLSLFGPALADGALPRLWEELRWFTSQLGDARNLDVLIKRFRGPCRGEPAELGAALESARGAAYGRVRAVVDSQRQRSLMLDLLRWVEIGAWRQNDLARGPLSEFAERQLRKRWRKVKAGGDEMDQLSEEPLHRLRIEVKKLRYAIEFLGGLLPKAKRKAFLDELETVQESLGHINDAATARELVGALLPAAPNQWVDCLTAGMDSHETNLDEAKGAFRRLRRNAGFWKAPAAPLPSDANG